MQLRRISGAPAIIAHRGGVGTEATENSRAAFDLAVARGADGLETDVGATRDGRVVIMHDDRLDRTTDGSGLLYKHTWAEVSGVRLHGGEPLLELDEFLDRYPRISVNIDIKNDPALEPALEVLSRRSDADLARLCLAAFSGKRLRRIREVLGDRVDTSLSPGEVGQLVAAAKTGIPLKAWPALRKLGGVVAAQVPEVQSGLRIVDQRFVALAHRLGLAVHVWTIDEPDTFYRLWDFGVDAIFTDNLQGMQAARREKQSN